MNAALFTRVWTEVKPAAKWTCILALPAVAVVLLASAFLGGIHGRGGIPLMLAYAPFIALDKFFHVRLAETPLNWIAVAAIEWLYLFIIIFLFRTFFLRKADLG